MDSIPVLENQEYLLFDSSFAIRRFSAGVQKYAAQTVVLGEDIRTCFPELVGLEPTCQEIRLGRLPSFDLKTIYRSKQPDKDVYFNLAIAAIADNLVIWLEDATEITIFRQSSMQQLNEAEISLDKLQRFEYCTNKIIASMRDVLLITSPQGRIERVNKSTTELFKRKKSELIDCLIDNIVSDPNFSHQKIYNSLITSQDAVKKVEVNFTDGGGQTIQIEFDCFIAPTEVKNFFNCVYIGRDITARKQAETEIRNALAREKELKELKSGFISMASHEFRNPLSSILLCVQNLRENSSLSSSDREFFVQSIEDAALTMNLLLEDILVLSKAESDKRRLKPEPINLVEFCGKIIQKLNTIYADRKVKFNHQIALDSIDLDRTAIGNILNNLLSNALKYSPSGATVELTVVYTASPAAIEIEVRDRGIGIPPEAQKHLFESFYRAGNVESVPGTGLGLSIVKKSVDLYQGSIAVDSELNQGTKIVVTLPLSEQARAK